MATLAEGGTPSPTAVAAETARIEHLVLHGSQRQWLRYLHRVVELVERSAADPGTEVQLARATATNVISNHHNLLLGLPGRGAQITAADRAKLAQLAIVNHEVKGPA